MSQLDGAGTPQNLALPLKLYWQPGCSSCLKMKEFVLGHGIPFESVNVLEDEDGFKTLEKLGIRMVPIAARGDVWANGAGNVALGYLSFKYFFILFIYMLSNISKKIFSFII